MEDNVPSIVLISSGQIDWQGRGRRREDQAESGEGAGLGADVRVHGGVRTRGDAAPGGRLEVTGRAGLAVYRVLWSEAEWTNRPGRAMKHCAPWKRIREVAGQSDTTGRVGWRRPLEP